MNKVIKIDAGQRFPFLAVFEGDKVTFYDTRYPHTSYGQQVATYFTAELRGHVGGLALMWGNPAWTISAEGMAQFAAALPKHTAPVAPLCLCDALAHGGEFGCIEACVDAAEMSLGRDLLPAERAEIAKYYDGCDRDCTHDA